MLGAGLQFGRSRGDDRFYNSAKARRNHQNRQSQDDLRRAQSDVTVHSQSLSVKDKSVVSSTNREQESREGFEETPNPVATPPLVSPLCNLERFLDSITPSVPAQYLSKEAAIDEYFKPINKEAEIIMKMQLEGEEKSMREMMKVMQTQALLEKAEADRIANVKNVEEINQHVKEKTSSSATPVECIKSS